MYNEPKIIHAGRALDDRGELVFCNEFQLAGVKRCYFVRNHRQGFVRAWHGHYVASTFLWPVEGTWRIGVVTLGGLADIPAGSRRCADPTVFMVDAMSIVHVPGGWFHGTQNLSTPAVLAIFSTATIEEIRLDDRREKWDRCNIWEENPR